MLTFSQRIFCHRTVSSSVVRIFDLYWIIWILYCQDTVFKGRIIAGKSSYDENPCQLTNVVLQDTGIRGKDGREEDGDVEQEAAATRGKRGVCESRILEEILCWEEDTVRVVSFLFLMCPTPHSSPESSMSPFPMPFLMNNLFQSRSFSGTATTKFSPPLLSVMWNRRIKSCRSVAATRSWHRR